MRENLGKRIKIELFEEFLFNMDEMLDHLVNDAARSGLDLDFSLHSLSSLEEYIFGTMPAMNAPERKQLSVSASRYLGEVVRRCYGGKWMLNIDDEKDLNYGQYVIVGHNAHQLEFNPHSKIKMLLMKRSSGFLKYVVSNQISPVEIKIAPE